VVAEDRPLKLGTIRLARLDLGRGGISSKGLEKLDAELKTYLDSVLQTLE